jgi:hypothetical protein
MISAMTERNPFTHAVVNSSVRLDIAAAVLTGLIPDSSQQSSISR